MASINSEWQLKTAREHIDCAISWIEDYDECQDIIKELEQIKNKLKELG